MTLNMDEKVTIKNLANWRVGFKRIESVGDVSIPANTTIRNLTRSEIITQCQSNNNLFTGTDGKGSHARIYIDDKATRVYVGFETEAIVSPDNEEIIDKGELQNVLTDDEIKEMFEYKTLATFKKKVEEKVITNAEKNKLAESVKKLNINDHAKIKFVEEYTGFKVESVTE